MAERRSPTRGRRAGGNGLVVFALVLAACTGGGDAGDEEAASPLADYLGLADDVQFGPRTEAGLALAVLAETERQEEIARCMAEEGFDYVPFVPASDTVAPTYDEIGGTDRAWLERHGFGVSTLWFWQEALPDGLVGYTVDDLAAEDPNLAIVTELSEAEEEAYGLALYGDGFLTEAVDEGMIEPEPGAEPDDEPDLGCHGTAGPTEIYEELALDFADELASMESAIQDDPRLAGAYDEVARCVREAGLEFSDPAAAVERIDDAMLAFESGVAVGDDGLGLAFTPAQEDELRRIQAEEIELAVAVEECGGSGPEFEDRLNEVRADHESEFIEANRDALERFRDSIGA